MQGDWKRVCGKLFFAALTTLKILEIKKLTRSNETGLFRRVSQLPYSIIVRLVSSAGRASDCSAGGRGFEPQTGPTPRDYQGKRVNPSYRSSN